MAKLSLPQPIVTFIVNVYQLVTKPSDQLQHLYQRRQAQFLAAVLVMIIPIVLITGSLQNLTLHQNFLTISKDFYFTLISTIIGLLAYILSRTRSYALAAHIVVVGGSVAVFVALFTEPVMDISLIGFLVFPILFSSLLLSVRITFLYFLLQIVLVSVAASAKFGADWLISIFPYLRFQLLSGFLIILGLRFRNQIAEDQNRIIQQNEDMLMKTNAELEEKVIDRTRIYEIATEELIDLLHEREAYEQEMANERNLLRTVIDNVPDHIFVLDRDGKYLLVNQALEKAFLKNGNGSILGADVYDLLATDLADEFFKMEADIMRTGKAVLNIEQVNTLNSEGIRHYLTSKLPLKDNVGNVIGLVGIARDVTESKKAELVLQQSYTELEQRVAERTVELSQTNLKLREQILDREKAETQLRYQASLLENVSDAILSVDDQFVVRSWNNAAARMYGWTEAEAVNRNAFEVMGVEISHGKRDEIMNRVLEEGFWHGETVDTRKDGTKLNVMASVSLLKDAEGNITGMVMVNRDITERKLVELAAHEQRVLAEALRDTAAAINSTLDLDEILDAILVHVERVLPYDSASIMLLDTDVARVVHGRGFDERGMDMQYVLALRFPLVNHKNLRDMVETGNPVIISDTQMFENWRLENVTNWIRSYMGAPIRIEGVVIGFINLDSAVPATFDQSRANKLQAFADQAGIAIHNANLFEAIKQHANQMEASVTARTAELVNERAQLHAIMDSMNEGVFGVLFGERPIRYANRSFQRLTGYDADEWSFDLMKPEIIGERSDFVYELDDLYNSLKAGMMWEGRGPVRRKDGVSFEAHVILTRIDNDDGSPVGTVTILRDVSQEKELEQQKSLFVANASHELRTPITNLMTRLYLIRKQPELLDTHLTVLDEVARRMKTLVEDLLDHSRFERGVIPLEPKLMDVRGLVSQVVMLQVPEADKKHITLTAKLPDVTLMSMVDPERMIQVITNLTMNAIHYTPEGGQVTVSAEMVMRATGDEWIRLHVQDSGIGVPAALLPNLFKPFFRVSEKTKGTGLGLSIARDIVRAHKGDISVESMPGVGSCFTVEIPAAVRAAD